MHLRNAVIAIVALVLANIGLYRVVVRQDLTADKRYTLSHETKQQMAQLTEPLEVSILLDGALNAGFTRLKKATEETLEELSYHGQLHYHTGSSDEAERLGLQPTVIHERTRDGRTAQTTVYPFVRLTYKKRSITLPLLQNQRGLSGEENLNHSIENLEYTFAEGIHTLLKEGTERIAFLEGHGELDEKSVYDLSLALSRYFQIDRGILGTDPEALNAYRCVIIADPETAFSDTDKYILDHYIMQGGSILWLVNGIRFSDKMLQQEGLTPVIAQELNLTDLFFRYGVRINAALVQDLQCLPIPVDVSSDPTQPNFQPLPWTYAPLLLTSEQSPVTRGVSQVFGSLLSCIDAVGGEDGLMKTILLATSTASTMTQAPAEVDLSDLTVERDKFRYAYIPVAMSVEGAFPSLYTHRMAPEGVKPLPAVERGKTTRQIFVAGGSIARNEWQHGQPLPVGYDRYTETLFGNRDFLVNAVLYLTDDCGLMALRSKSVTLRLLNDRRAHDKLTQFQLISLLCPILLISLIGLAVWAIRRKLYLR